MTEPLTITLDGTPVPKARARSGRAGFYTPRSTAHYENDLGWAAKLAMRKAGVAMFIGPVKIEATFARLARATAKPDVDNYCKAALDSLRGIAFIDDAQVVELHARKVCSSTPRTTLTITTAQPSTEGDKAMSSEDTT
jgi:crossover junction endodeoxyribonuclease RusA